MNIAISGYGRMGKLIHKTALEKEHTITAILDNDEDWKDVAKIKESHVIIDFSLPHTVIHNIEKSLNLGIPIIVGTTGWYDKLNQIKELCRQKNGAVFYAPNFSIGVNLFFELNKYLASFMNNYPEYNVRICETHHTEKIDAPSGTAIKMAEDLLKILHSKQKWTNFAANSSTDLEIFSERINNIVGNHKVIYASNEDEIIIEHNAKSRKGFAEGALIAAEWLVGKKGIFEMKDMLGT